MDPNGTDVLCPLVTPFLGDGGADGVDVETLETHVEWLVEAGIDGLVPVGTTGEFASLTDEERETVIRTTVDAAPADVPVVAGAAATSVVDAAGWVDRVDDLGADAALVPPPYFHGASGPAGHRRFFESVLARSSGDVFLYNFPGPVGEPLPAEVAVALAERPRVRGLKDSSGDVDYLGRVLARTGPSFPVLVGADSLLGTGVAVGAAGGVNGLANVAPKQLLEIAEFAGEGDVRGARDRTRRLRPLLEAAAAHGYAGTVKAGLVARGIYGTAAVRPPLVPPAESACEAIGEAVSTLLEES
ncbi:dihydrodipicolinate synthase family protein [Halorarum halobium]|uniref:dihydrodipicolinate synthase family protein n=1 Tax=Halorarum halobium TaxID=3075121 RepID=UPI0028AEA76A|nr:dihydrodipicolinate synthase family protein [Halobaculum sp. XH14]